MIRPMRRSRATDWVLLATLLPAYLVIQGISILEELGHGPWWFPFSVTGAQGSSGHPLVDRLNETASPVRVGDVALRFADIELRGLSRSRLMDEAVHLLRGGQPFPVEVERGGERLVLTVAPVPDPYWWFGIPASASLVLTATFLLLRAPYWHLSRRFFALALSWCMYRAADVGTTEPILALAYVAATPLAVALTLSCCLEWTEAARPLRPWQRLLPWAIGLIGLASTGVHELSTLPIGLWAVRSSALSLVLGFVIALLGIARAYRRAGTLERRQVRWLLYGLAVAMLPVVVQYSLVRLGIPFNWVLIDNIGSLFAMAVPLGTAVSVVGYRWLDIDRLISATAAATLLGVAALAGTLALAPRLARATATALGVDADTTQLALSMALAAVLVPAYRALRPWLDRRLFAEQHALGLGFERLRASLIGCGSLEELARRAGEGSDALLRPESVAIYARAGEAFTPLFVRGRAAPPAFESKSALVCSLEARGTPLFSRAKELGPFERAALETLGAEVVVPLRRGEQLVAFTCLGGKRSGDIYTATDLAHLAALAERCSDVLARLGAHEVAREAQAMQSALRRYVPGAVAERVLRGEVLEPAEREVSVLFVDIRDYTRITEGLPAADVFATLNEHTERVSRIVQECGGTIVEFNGDGMMAVFGAPGALPRNEQQAVEAARRIVDSMPTTLGVGVGVATGSAFVGSIRSTDRLIWSAVGSTTNLASRLQSLTRELAASIAIDELTRTRAGYVCADFVRHSDVAIRGRTSHFDVFALQLGSANAAG